jgi:hypothetical protein
MRSQSRQSGQKSHAVLDRCRTRKSALFARRRRTLVGVAVYRQFPAGTIIASFSHSECNACGQPCDPCETKHITRLPDYSGTTGGRGCGIEFMHITTPSSHPKTKERARALRPDLEFIWFKSDT